MFYTQVQKDGETFANFVAALQQLTEHSDFGPALNLMLWDRIVCGIRNASLLRRLLAEPELTFKKVFDLSQVAKTEANNVQELQAVQPKMKQEPVMVVKEVASKEHSTPKACYRCSDTTHLVNYCPFKTAICR